MPNIDRRTSLCNTLTKYQLAPVPSASPGSETLAQVASLLPTPHSDELEQNAAQRAKQLAAGVSCFTLAKPTDLGALKRCLDRGDAASTQRENAHKGQGRSQFKSAMAHLDEADVKVLDDHIKTTSDAHGRWIAAKFESRARDFVPSSYILPELCHPTVSSYILPELCHPTVNESRAAAALNASAIAKDASEQILQVFRKSDVDLLAAYEAEAPKIQTARHGCFALMAVLALQQRVQALDYLMRHYQAEATADDLLCFAVMRNQLTSPASVDIEGVSAAGVLRARCLAFEMRRFAQLRCFREAPACSQTPLLVQAAMEGDLRLAQLCCLDAGAFHRDFAAATVAAVSLGDTQLFKLLMERAYPGQPPTEETFLSKAREEKDCASLCAATQQGNLGLVDKIVKGASLTPEQLKCAARQGLTRVIDTALRTANADAKCLWLREAAARNHAETCRAVLFAMSHLSKDDRAWVTTVFTMAANAKKLDVLRSIAGSGIYTRPELKRMLSNAALSHPAKAELVALAPKPRGLLARLFNR